MQRRIANVAADSNRVQLTDHAWQRMRQRRVLLTQVLGVLQHGALVEPAHHNIRGHWQCTLQLSVASDLVKVATMYHYTKNALQNVWLRNGYRKEKTPYGPTVSFIDVVGMHRLIGRSLALQPQLTGAEVRFLRKELSLSQVALAQLLGCTEQEVSLRQRRGR